ncbi:MAG TPA: amidohydrolase family protein [Caulobacteraceae bacterium]|nr:amidohydrolase family protein [Caulobacteraceae bacterium]
MPEAILEPQLPIVDPHHHLWIRPVPPPTSLGPEVNPFVRVVARSPRYLLDELLADLTSSHNIIATVFTECGSMYRAAGPAHMKPLGETEFVNGIAAMTASGIFGPVRACAGIVGHADCTAGEANVDELLEAHLKTSDRFRGIRHSCSSDADPNVLGPLARQPPGLYLSDAFRAGYARLGKYGLSFDAWLLEPQLPDLIGLARKFPETPVVLDHVGTPLGLAAYEGRREERFGIWRENIRTLAELPNVNVKLGGLAMPFCNFPSFLSDPPAPSTQLAAEWGPYLETCIEAFGPGRCMFESNFPVDLGSCDYATLWNAFKVFAKHYSADEKADLFAGTATRVYRLNLPN